jgi:hypothetical protein
VGRIVRFSQAWGLLAIIFAEDCAMLRFHASFPEWMAYDAMPWLDRDATIAVFLAILWLFSTRDH